MATQTKIVRATFVNGIDAVSAKNDVETVLKTEYNDQWRVTAFAIAPDYTFFFLMEHD